MFIILLIVGVVRLVTGIKSKCITLCQGLCCNSSGLCGFAILFLRTQ